MIYTALNYVVQELNRYLMRRFSTQDDKAILGSILDESGSVPEGNQNKIILSLVNLENETNRQYNRLQTPVGNSNIAQNLPFNFNMDVLVTSLFTNYSEALKFLSEAVYFFQAKQVFTHENSPGLDPKIEKLAFEIIIIEYREMHNLWTALGAKYMPSILFKIRMLSFQSKEIQAIHPSVNTLDPDTKPNQA